MIHHLQLIYDLQEQREQFVQMSLTEFGGADMVYISLYKLPLLGQLQALFNQRQGLAAAFLKPGYRETLLQSQRIHQELEAHLAAFDDM